MANKTICTDNYSIREWISETHETDFTGDNSLFGARYISKQKYVIRKFEDSVRFRTWYKGEKNDLELVKKVARKYNAVIAGSRGIVEDGFIEKRKSNRTIWY